MTNRGPIAGQPDHIGLFDHILTQKSATHSSREIRDPIAAEFVT
jgi:hypothetical protein